MSLPVLLRCTWLPGTTKDASKASARPLFARVCVSGMDAAQGDASPLISALPRPCGGRASRPLHRSTLVRDRHSLHSQDPYQPPL